MKTITQHYLSSYNQTKETLLPIAYPEWVTAIDEALVSEDTTKIQEDFGSHMVEIYEAIKTELQTAKSDTDGRR